MSLNSQRTASFLLSVALLACGVAPAGRAEESRQPSPRWWKRLLLPFRAPPLPTRTGAGCGIGIANCLSGAGSQQFSPAHPGTEEQDTVGNPEDTVWLRTKTDRRGPFGHHWLEVETSAGAVGFGFGPATVPFVDAGQIALQDEHGNIERYSGAHPLQPLTLPPLGYEYAREPGDGIESADPIPLTRREADRIIQRFRELRRVRPYFPLLNDCRTFVCRVKAKAQGRSTLPCHLLFKGYW